MQYIYIQYILLYAIQYNIYTILYIYIYIYNAAAVPNTLSSNLKKRRRNSDSCFHPVYFFSIKQTKNIYIYNV